MPHNLFIKMKYEWYWLRMPELWITTKCFKCLDVARKWNWLKGCISSSVKVIGALKISLSLMIVNNGVGVHRFGGLHWKILKLGRDLLPHAEGPLRSILKHQIKVDNNPCLLVQFSFLYDNICIGINRGVFTDCT